MRTRNSTNTSSRGNVEIVVAVDSDLSVFVPLLNQSFPAIFGDTIAHLPRVENMRADLDAEKLAQLGETRNSTSTTSAKDQIAGISLSILTSVTAVCGLPFRLWMRAVDLLGAFLTSV